MSERKPNPQNTPIHAQTKDLSPIFKKAGIRAHQAKVALCLDVSESMSPYYESGKVQFFTQKVLGLGAYLDVNSQVDVFLFSEKTHHAGEMTQYNYATFLDDALENYNLTGTAKFSSAIKKIRKFYFPDASLEAEPPIKKPYFPIYVLFVSNGNTEDEDETAIELSKASHSPVFWQFITIGVTRGDVGNGFWAWLKKPFLEDYSFLQKLDDLPDRFIDNADFFNISDPFKVNDEELFEKLMTEYPDWIKEAISKKILNGKSH